MTAQGAPPGGKPGGAERDFVPVVRFLASEDARFTTGQVFAVDGGTIKLR